jgi:hypothetical protein
MKYLIIPVSWRESSPKTRTNVFVVARKISRRFFGVWRSPRYRRSGMECRNPGLHGCLRRRPCDLDAGVHAGMTDAAPWLLAEILSAGRQQANLFCQCSLGKACLTRRTISRSQCFSQLDKRCDLSFGNRDLIVLGLVETSLGLQQVEIVDGARVEARFGDVVGVLRFLYRFT